MRDFEREQFILYRSIRRMWTGVRHPVHIKLKFSGTENVICNVMFWADDLKLGDQLSADLAPMVEEAYSSGSRLYGSPTTEVFCTASSREECKYFSALLLDMEIRSRREEK